MPPPPAPLSSGQTPSFDHDASLEHFLGGTCYRRGQVCFERSTTPVVVDGLQRAFPCSPEQISARATRRAQAVQAQADDAAQLMALQGEFAAAVEAVKTRPSAEANLAVKAAKAALNAHGPEAKRRREQEAAAEAADEPAWLKVARRALGRSMKDKIAGANTEWDSYVLCKILSKHMRVAFLPRLRRRWRQQQQQQQQRCCSRSRRQRRRCQAAALGGCLRAVRCRIKAATDKATRAMHACGHAGVRSRVQMRASGGCVSQRARLCARVCE